MQSINTVYSQISLEVMPITILTCRYTEHTSIFKTMGAPTEKNLFIPEFLKLRLQKLLVQKYFKHPFQLGFLQKEFRKAYQLNNQLIQCGCLFFRKHHSPCPTSQPPRAAASHNFKNWFPFS